MLLGTELVEEFVATTILTGRVKDESPVSVVLIATPECGKTSIVMSRPCKAAMPLTDATGKGLMELCKMRAELSHFILNDLVAIMSHRQTVNQYTMAVINAMTEEGITAVAFPGTVDTFAAGKRAIIACTTSDLFVDSRRWWHKIGLSSRMLPFAYDHDKALQIKIKNLIQNGKSGQSLPAKPMELVVPNDKIDVRINKPEIATIRKMADFRASVLEDPKGYRRLKQFICLTKAHAIYRTTKNPVVNAQDINFLERVDRYISYTTTTPL